MMTKLFGVLLIALLTGTARAERPNDEDFQRYGNRELLFVGEVVAFREGPTAMSHPPIYGVMLKVKVSESLRGGAKSDATLDLTYRQRGGAPPRYDVGQTVVVAASVVHRAGQPMPLSAEHIIVPDDAELAAVRKIAELPIGWTLKDGKPFSPWAKIDGYRWPNSKLMQCTVTHHPVHVDSPIELKVEPIIDPAKQIQWTNPDGDGEFRITVTNPTDEPIVAPLWRAGDEIRWDHSLLILCQGTAHTLPGTASPPSDIVFKKLDPGESASTTINVLKLEGIDWPRGGSRVELMFAVGSHGSTHSFYYMSRHHDKLRDAAE